MFCKIFQTFSTQNLAGQLHILQSLTNVVKNFFPTFSTDTIRIYSTAGRNAPRRTCPPPDSGRGRGPSDTSYREAMTQETMGGAGVEGAEGDRNGVPPEPGPCSLPAEKRRRAADSGYRHIWWFDN